MRTAIVSDLHLGAASGGDLLRRGRFAELLAEAISGCDRLVLLGDVLELRDRPLAEAVAASGEAIATLAAALDGGEVIVVAGNHDHHLIEPWLERRALAGTGALGLEQIHEPEGAALEALVEPARSAGATVRSAYPGLWVADGVYATHGHFLDRHLTVPTLERLGLAAVQRMLGIEPEGPDPLDAPDEPSLRTVEDYERVQGPVYAVLYELAQSGAGTEAESANPSLRLWSAVGGGSSRSSRARGWVLDAIAIPGAVGVANRLGLGPVRSDLSLGAITRAGIAALGTVVANLGIEAEHLIFGHTHRRGPLEYELGWEAGETRLWNTGSWALSPALLRSAGSRSPYWPGTVCFVEPGAEPRLEHLLDGVEIDDLRGD